MYVKYTYVDAVSGVSVTQEPARNGPVPPAIAGLEFGFALESEYPTLTPTLYGTCADGAVIDLPGVLAAVSEAEYQAALEREMKLRETQRRSRAIRENNRAYTEATVALTADYPQIEKDTWPTQNEQAAAWVADPENASTPWIDRAAAERGIDREEYLRRTLVKAEQFKILSAFLTGRRQRYEDQIKAGGDPVLDYELTPEVQQDLYQVQQTIMNPDVSAAELQESLA